MNVIPPSSSAEALKPGLIASLARLLGVDPQRLDPDEKLADIGLDSIVAMEWTRHLSAEYGLPLRATKVYDYPTLTAFAKYLASELASLIPEQKKQLSQVSTQVDTKPVFVGAKTSDASLAKMLTSSLGRVLGMTPESIDPSEKFVDLGLDSIVASEWTRALNQQFNLDLKATRVYEHPTLQEFQCFLAKEIASGSHSAEGAKCEAAMNSEPLPAESAFRASEVQSSVPTPKEILSIEKVTSEIVQITMQDQVHKNACTHELIYALEQAFAAVAKSKMYKVVILTGYDSYFATGGTREGLLDIQQGHTTYNDTRFYRLPLDCELPVIAAMQGHALGAGWSMGVCCDFLIMSRESYYSTNFMQFGFTPGVGSTLLFPYKFGTNFAQEMLFTGRRYRGSELEEKELGIPVLPRDQVLPHAIEFATALAASPRASLIELKRHMSEELRQRFPDTVRRELKMHERTFVDKGEVRTRIDTMLGSTAPPAAIEPSAICLQKTALPALEPRKTDVAVIGISLSLPKADTPDAFWKNIISGRNCVAEVPASRWNWRDYTTAANSPLRWGGFLDELKSFDPEFFNISTEDAAHISAGHKLLMSQIWAALENGGITPSKLAEEPTGVFVAVGPEESHIAAVASLVPSMLPNRISYALDLRGPSEYCESGCASFPVALHRAIRAINSGECEQAIVGAVHLLSSPLSYVAIDSIGYLSRDGRSRSFQADANGYARSEGAGAIVIRRLDKALFAGDQILGLVKGTGVAHGGGGMSLYTPTSLGMQTAISQAFQAAGFAPQTVGYLEAHGTGSFLSDALEVNACVEGYAKPELQRATAALPVDAYPCRIGSLKPSIGHGEIVSGFSALAKVLLALKHKTLPGIPGLGPINGEIDLGSGRFELSSRNLPWQALHTTEGDQLPRRAAINSYGYSGVNAHILIEEFVPTADACNESAINDPCHVRELIVLSAPNEDRLRARVIQLQDYLQQELESVRRQPALRDIAHTLQVGRVAMRSRLAIVASSLTELRTAVDLFLTGHGHAKDLLPCGMLFGTALPRREIPGAAEVLRLIEQRDLARIAALWVRGVEVAWSALRGDLQARRISLPIYPFTSAGHQELIEPQRARNEAVEDRRACESNSVPTADPSIEGRRVMQAVAENLRLETSQIAPDESLFVYGIDSQAWIGLKRDLEKSFGFSIPLRIMMSHTSVTALSAWLEEASSQTAQPSAVLASCQSYRDPIVLAALEKVKFGDWELGEFEAALEQRMHFVPA